MNIPGVLAKLRAFRGLLTSNSELYDRHAQDYWKRPQWKETEDQIYAQLPALKLIAQQVDTVLAGQFIESSGIYTWKWINVDRAVVGLIGKLESQKETEALLGPAGPQIAAGGLHRWVWGPAASLWDDGHPRAAIQAAATQLDLALQAKLNRYDIGGTDLVTQAFSSAAPEPGKPRLRLPGLSPHTNSYTSAHEGAMNFGRGCFMGIRNFATHDLTEPDEQEALEILSALSVLARWIDRSEVATE